MVDITMCNNEKCKLSADCYRFLALPSQYQSYSHFVPEEDGTCEHFIDYSTSLISESSRSFEELLSLFYKV